MIHKAHRNLARHAGTPKPVDVGDTKAVEAKVRLFNLDEELLPTPGRLKRKIHSELSLAVFQFLEQRTDSRRHRDGEHPFLSSLWRGKGDLVLYEVHAGQRDSCLSETATSMEADLKRRLHPLRLIPQRHFDLNEFLIRELRLFRWFVLSNFQAHER